MTTAQLRKGYRDSSAYAQAKNAVRRSLNFSETHGRDFPPLFLYQVANDYAHARAKDMPGSPPPNDGVQWPRDTIQHMLDTKMIASAKQAWQTLEKWGRQGKYSYGTVLDLGWKEAG